MKLIALLSLVGGVLWAADKRIEKLEDEKTHRVAVGFPQCVNNPSEIEEILSAMKANSKGKNKYSGYRKALSHDSDQQLVARLIYAETLAANCPSQSREVLPLIARVISNRIQIRKDGVKSVVYERDQFASSLNKYSSSRYLDFLCPNNYELWGLAFDHAGKGVSERSSIAVHYFLYKHHPGWDAEPWRLPESRESLASKVRDCIRVFDNNTWK
ncbi:MAG: hypothetical protein JNL11_03560 [Bdellovibrionaceae bacterium]|nr:hypothetical protein [Pseudobdellovibrionaceae bacterium]